MKIYTNKSKAKLSYCVVWKNAETGERERRTFVDLQEAERHKTETEKYLATVNAICTKLSQTEITNFAIQQKRLGETPISIAVDYYLSNYKKEKTTPFYQDLAFEYIIEKKRLALSEKYLESLENCLLASCETFKGEIGKITRDDIQKYLDDNWKNPVTKNSVRRNIIGLFRWSKFNKHCLPNDYQTAPELVPLFPEAVTNPEIYSPEDLKKILSTARRTEPRIIPFIAIAAFTGIRTAEICRLNFNKINWEEAIIPLSSDITKTKNRRLVPMRNTLLAWLQLGTREGMIVPYKEVHDPLSRVIKAAGVKSRKNGFRHSFCSYDLAFGGNPAMTALTCGHSPIVLEQHYKSIQLEDGRFITKELATKYFAVTP